MRTYKQMKKVFEKVQFEVPSEYEEDASHFITKASAAHRAGKKQFTLNGKVYPVTIKKPVEEDMYSADRKTGADGKLHPRHRISFVNKDENEDEEDKQKEESASTKFLQTKLANMQRMRTVRIPTPAERRAEMEKQKQMKKEEAEQIDELSKSTLGSYIKKAADSAAVKRKIGSDFEHMADKAKKPSNKAAATALADKYKSASRDRRANIGKAVDRLTKEEVEQLDEKTPTKQEVKQAIGIARDKRYAGGNMTGAVKAMDKINKGLAQHPAVSKELRKQNEEVDQKEYDYEGDMAKNQLNRIMMHSKHFIEMLQDDTNLPEWVQSKITKAEDYISSAHDYMMGEMQKEEVELEEKMDLAKTDMGDVIKDFQKSDAPQFKGKSKEKKRQMAIAAKLGAEREAGMREEVDTGQYDARKFTPSSKEKDDDVFRKHRERVKAMMKAKEASVKKEENETISFADFLKEFDYDKNRPGVYTHKGTYGTSYNSERDDHDDDAPKKPANPAVKRGRGRPVGSKSGARQAGSTTKKRTGVDYTGFPLHLPNKNR